MARTPKAAPKRKDLDPQIVWNGAKITLTKDQVKQLEETGEVEIGDAQLVWRGKDRQDWSDLVVNAPPLYIQEKIHPKAIIDDLKRRSEEASARRERRAGPVRRLQRPRSGGAGRVLPARPALVEPHDPRRQPAGDGEPRRARGLRGKVQCIYFDPPYGIKFNSNWQVSTQSRAT
jgi:adenine-specific DNA-methyltransferase